MEVGSFQDLRGERKFLFLSTSSPRPPGFLLSQPSVGFIVHWSLESWWPNLVLRHCAPRCSRPQGTTAGTAVKAPGQLGQRDRLGSYPSCSARSELWPTDFPPKRARNPLPFSPLVSSSFLCGGEKGGDGGGGDVSQPPPPRGRGASGVGALRRQPPLPFTPALRVCPCSHSSCCCRLGCLGGRLRIT